MDLMRDKIVIAGMFGDVALSIAEQQDGWFRFYQKAGMGWYGVEISARGVEARKVSGMHSFADWVVSHAKSYIQAIGR